MQCSEVQYGTMQYNTMQCSIAQCIAVQYSTVQFLPFYRIYSSIIPPIFVLIKYIFVIMLKVKLFYCMCIKVLNKIFVSRQAKISLTTGHKEGTAFYNRRRVQLDSLLGK